MTRIRIGIKLGFGYDMDCSMDRNGDNGKYGVKNRAVRLRMVEDGR